jgi:hypothetical protein
MRLQKTETGRECLSDSGIQFLRVRDVDRTDGTHGDGWRVEVRRQGGRRIRLVASHVTRTLAEATDWARPHWRPAWLCQLVEGLEERHPARALFQEAVRSGEPSCFLAFLDALEEAGPPVDRIDLLGMARADQIFKGLFPLTVEEVQAKEQFWTEFWGMKTRE